MACPNRPGNASSAEGKPDGSIRTQAGRLPHDHALIVAEPNNGSDFLVLRNLAGETK
jgi:hypothetical protein